MAYDSNNIFAKILRGEIPAHRVYENDHALALIDVMPQSVGHTLVIPKLAQAEDFLDIDPVALSYVIVATQIVAKAVDKAFKPDGVRIVQFNRAAAGQTIFHLHFHVLPCYEGVDMNFHAREMADQGMLKEHAERIRQALASLQ
jgi:histidine triad (HIT) family protein